MNEPAFLRLPDLDLKIRPPSFNELERYVALINACELSVTGRPRYSTEHYQMEFRTPGLNIEDDVRVAVTPSGDFVACMEVWTVVDPPVRPWLWGRVHPDWRGRGLSTGLMCWALKRSTAALARAPAHLRVAAHAMTYHGHRPAENLFTSLGMAHVRTNWRMTRDLPDSLEAAAWPIGISPRAFHHPGELRALYQVEDEVFRGQWSYVPRPFETGFRLWQHHQVEHPHFDPALWSLAVQAHEIVGFVRSYPTKDGDPRAGFVESIGVRKPWRGQGIGLALLRHAFLALRTHGCARVALTVDSENFTGATRLYKKAGMTIARQHDFYEMELRPGESYWL